MTETLPLATVELAELRPGKPATDRAVLCKEDGRTYRVRVAGAVADRAHGDGPTAAFLEAIEISVVPLDQHGRTVRNAHDQAIVTSATRLTVDADTLAGPGGLEGAVMRTVRHLIHQSIDVAAGQAKIGAVLAAWSGPDQPHQLIEGEMP